MTTTNQDQKFLDHVISRTLLEDAIAWIVHNLEPDDVFDHKTLAQWAESNNFVLDDGE